MKTVLLCQLAEVGLSSAHALRLEPSVPGAGIAPPLIGLLGVVAVAPAGRQLGVVSIAFSSKGRSGVGRHRPRPTRPGGF
jgi:hypothetical protein